VTRREARIEDGYVSSSEWMDAATLWYLLKPRTKLSPAKVERLVKALARNDGAFSNQDLCVAIEMLSAKGHGAQCRRIIDGMWDGGYEVPDSYTYSVAAAAIGESGRPQEAEELLTEMREHGVPVTLSNYNAVIRAWAISGNMTATERLLDELQSQNLQPDAGTYTAAVLAVSTERAVRMLQEMMELGMTLDWKALRALIGAFLAGGQHSQALQALLRSENMGQWQDVDVYTSVIDSCLAAESYDQAFQAYQALLAKKRRVDPQEFQKWYRSFYDGGELEKAMEVFSGYLSAGGSADLNNLFKEVMAACDEVGDGLSAVRFLSKMKEMHLKLDTQVYMSAMSACEQRDLWPEVLRIMREMEASGVRMESGRIAKAYTESIFLDLRQGRVERAYRMFLDMEPRGISPSRSLLEAMIQGCEKAKRRDRAEQLREQLLG